MGLMFFNRLKDDFISSHERAHTTVYDGAEKESKLSYSRRLILLERKTLQKMLAAF
jgi:hypothetical protein